MAELAKSFITISDESAYGAGVNAIIPLYVIATESNKVLDTETGEIAPGTTFANELLVMTSQRDVINTFGVPTFTKVNGTVMQGDELNEVGLLGLYDAMGSSSLGYAVRANIDLNQLKGTSVEPRQDVENGTKWLDLYESEFGVYRSNGSDSIIASNQWDQVKVEVVSREQAGEKEESTIIFEPTSTGGQFYEYISGWKLIGSNEWKETFKTPQDNVDRTFNFSAYNDMPENQPQGSIWISTSNYNNGSKLVLKTYDSVIKNWASSEVKMFTSYNDAETYYGSNLSEGVYFALCGEDGTATIEMKEYVKNVNIIPSDESKDMNLNPMISGQYTFYVSGHPYHCNCTNLRANAVVVQFNKLMKTEGISNVTAAITDGILNYESNGVSIGIEPSDTFTNNTGITNTTEPSNCWETMTDVKIQVEVPTDEPAEGTLWYDTTEQFDILVGNGAIWKGLEDAHPGAKLYVTSEKPIGAISNYSLWIDTNATEYPTIYRYEGGKSGWKLLDNSDQTTPYGVLFADARYYDDEDKPLTFKINEDGVVEGTILHTTEKMDPDAPKATAYPKEMILVNTRFTGNNVKEYKVNAFPGEKEEEVPGKTLVRWVSASGNALNGAGLFGGKAQRKMIVEALNSAINSCEELRSINYDFFYACCPGYPEVDAALLNLNSDKKDMFYIVSDTPKTLKPTVRTITDWGSPSDGTEHGLDGRLLRSPYMTRQYPSMGLTSNVDGSVVAVPTSLVKMNNLLNLPKGQICAGSQNGIVTNVTSVGYITDENEYASVSLNDGLGEAVTAQAMNPIMMRRNTGLLLWGENTENNGNTSLSDEHAILTILRLKRELDIACTPFFFRKNTKSTREDFNFVLSGILSAYVTNEELYDFVLDTETPNTSETISRKELHANIAVEIVKGIEFIYIPIRVVNTGTLSQ